MLDNSSVITYHIHIQYTHSVYTSSSIHHHKQTCTIYHFILSFFLHHIQQHDMHGTKIIAEYACSTLYSLLTFMLRSKSKLIEQSETSLDVADSIMEKEVEDDEDVLGNRIIGNILVKDNTTELLKKQEHQLTQYRFQLLQWLDHRAQQCLDFLAFNLHSVSSGCLRALQRLSFLYLFFLLTTHPSLDIRPYPLRIIISYPLRIIISYPLRIITPYHLRNIIS